MFISYAIMWLFLQFKNRNLGVKIQSQKKKIKAKKFIFKTLKKWPKGDFSLEQGYMVSLVYKACCDSLAHKEWR